ncbi:MAG: hypothetical protein ABIK79_15725 [Chloroflexota bacterium]
MTNRTYTSIDRRFTSTLAGAIVFSLVVLMASIPVLASASSAPLPCVLLVDDDQDNPDVHAYYTSALDELGTPFDVWDVAAQGEPAAGDLLGYKMVVWFTGYPRRETFTSANEEAVASYLDAGGRFLLSSEDYLQDRGLTSFGQIRLRISDYVSDVNRTDLGGTGQSPGGWLGPYSLTPPDGWLGYLYTDSVVKGSG